MITAAMRHAIDHARAVRWAILGLAFCAMACAAPAGAQNRAAQNGDVDRILPPKTVEATPTGAATNLSPWVWTVTPRLETRSVQFFATVTTPEGRVYPALRAVPGVGESSFDPGGPVRITIVDTAGQTVVDLPFPGSEQRVGAGDVSGNAVSEIGVDLRMFGQSRRLTWTVEAPAQEIPKQPQSTTAAAPPAVERRAISSPMPDAQMAQAQDDAIRFEPEPSAPAEVATQSEGLSTLDGPVPELAGAPMTAPARISPAPVQARGPFVPDPLPTQPSAPETQARTAPPPMPAAAPRTARREGPTVSMDITPRTTLAPQRETATMTRQPDSRPVPEAQPQPEIRQARQTDVDRRDLNRRDGGGRDEGRNDGRWASWTPGAARASQNAPQSAPQNDGGPVSLAPGSSYSASEPNAPAAQPSRIVTPSRGVQTAALPRAQAPVRGPSYQSGSDVDQGYGQRRAPAPTAPRTAPTAMDTAYGPVPRPMAAPWRQPLPRPAMEQPSDAYAAGAREPQRPLTPDETSRTIEQLLSGASGMPVQVPPRRPDAGAPYDGQTADFGGQGRPQSVQRNTCTKAVYTYTCAKRPAFGEEAGSIPFTCDRDLESCCSRRKSRVARLCGGNDVVKSFDCGCW